MQRAALYIRVSTDDQIEFSPAAQKKALLAYAQRNDIIVDSDYIFIDEGFSGRKAEKRPAFMSMISAAKVKPRPFDIILVHKFDRFARSREDSVVYKSLLKKECGIRVISISEQLEDDKFSIILESMLEAMAEYYSINLSEEVKKGMTEKAMRGGFQSRPSYGYDVKDNKLVINQEEKHYVKLIFDRYLNGDHSLYRLAKEMNALGARTKTGKLFENRTVEYILHNPIYIGKITWTPTGKKNRNFDNGATIIADGEHEPIIDKKVFEAVQEVLAAQKAKNGYKRRPNSEFKHWLSGILKCSNCGGSLVYNGNKKYPGFQCRNYSGGKCTISHSISIGKIETAVTDSIKENFLGVNGHYQTVNNPRRQNTQRISLEKQLSRIENKLERAKNAYLEGIDTAEEYKQNKAIILAEKTELETKLNETKVVKFDEMAFRKNLKRLYQILINPNAAILEKSNALHETVAKIVYDKTNESVEIYYFV